MPHSSAPDSNELDLPVPFPTVKVSHNLSKPPPFFSSIPNPAIPSFQTPSRLLNFCNTRPPLIHKTSSSSPRIRRRKNQASPLKRHNLSPPPHKLTTVPDLPHSTAQSASDSKFPATHKKKQGGPETRDCQMSERKHTPAVNKPIRSQFSGMLSTKMMTLGLIKTPMITSRRQEIRHLKNLAIKPNLQTIILRCLQMKQPGKPSLCSDLAPINSRNTIRASCYQSLKNRPRITTPKFAFAA